MRAAHALAIRATFHPFSAGLSEKPNPGRAGTTTWNASFSLPPCAVGSVSGRITSRNSKTDPGHPWVKIMGSACSCLERMDEVDPEAVNLCAKLRERV